MSRDVVQVLEACRVMLDIAWECGISERDGDNKPTPNAEVCKNLSHRISNLLSIPSATEQTTDQWWRDASRERPARDRLVIAWTKEYGALLANRDTTNPDFGWSCCGKVTHWMPLPEVPNVK